MTSNQQPIGIFDSGIGGLTVLKELRREMPHEDIVYFGDTAHVPYGTKSKETITRFSTDNVHFLQSFDVKIVVVACNTASSLSLDTLKEKFPHQMIIGVIEPGVTAALRVTKNRRIGVIGTKATIHSGVYEACLRRLDPSVKVYSEACPLFVPLVEEGWLNGEVVEKVARVYLDPLKAFGIDTLILGCTHYPLLAHMIQKIFGEKVQLINSAEETARQTRQLLAGPTDPRESKVRFYVSDEPEPFRTLGERFLGMPIHSVAKIGDHFKEGLLNV